MLFRNYNLSYSSLKYCIFGLKKKKKAYVRL